MIDWATTDQRYRAITRFNVGELPQWRELNADLREAVEIVSMVLPFRANHYLVDELIDWDRVPDDPMFRLTFPHRDMLDDEHFCAIRDLLWAEAEQAEIDALVMRIRYALNPHPAGQMSHNVPMMDGEPVSGMQHKYRETILFFPSHGQTCHAYCTFCFRWAQFVGIDDLKFANKEAGQLVRYVRRHPEVTDVLITGGDPMIMKTSVLRRYVEPLLDIESVQTIRIGTKSLSYWPQRFTIDPDGDDLMRLFDRVVASGKHLAIMGHYSHPVEFSTEIAQAAIRRVRATGANIRMQSPLLRHINDDPQLWSQMWSEGVQMGAIPYYMFIERDTGARRYFEVPLVQAWELFQQAYQSVSGMARTVRGPSMSCFPGKCHVLGVTEIGGVKAFVLEYLQARDPSLVRRPFFAKFDASASWYDDLEPFSVADEPFFISPESDDAVVPLSIMSGAE